MNTQNDEYAATAGNDKPNKQPTEAYDTKHGIYQDQPPYVKAGASVEGTVQPLRLRRGR